MNGIDWTTCKRWRRQAVPVTELMGSPDGLAPMYAEEFKAADVVMGYDVGRRPFGPDAFVVFDGRGALQDAAHSGRSHPMRVFVVAYDQRTAELEALAACCEAHRGGCDYPRSTGT